MYKYLLIYFTNLLYIGKESRENNLNFFIFISTNGILRRKIKEEGILGKRIEYYLKIHFFHKRALFK
jgi:hypothetical protein